MCYHLSKLRYKQLDLEDLTPEDLARLSAEINADILKEPVYHVNGFTFPEVEMFSTESPNKLKLYRWGLIPSWAKDKELAFKLRTGTLNARSDTLYDKPSYRTPAKLGQRVLIPVTGLFEWHFFGKNKYPFYVKMPARPVFFMGGIYDTWVDKQTGEIFKTFSLVTTQANELMAKVHNDGERMPVMIPEHRISDWLNPNLSKEEVLAMCVPYTEEAFEAHTVSKLLTSRTASTDVPEVQAKLEYPELEFDKSLK